MITGRPKIYSINESYFSDLNNRNCQWAGYIAADGCIIGGRSVKLACKTDDLEILKSFNEDLESTYPIKKTSTVLSNGKSYFGYQIVFRSQGIIGDLEKNFRIGARKSLTLRPPLIKDSEFQKSYMVGLINGDGSIFRDYARNIVNLRVTGTHEICLWCKGIYCSVFQLEDKFSYIYKNGRIFSFSVGNINALLFLRSISNLGVFYLKRKWDVLNTPNVTSSGRNR
jgi:hypothetical protein